MALPRIRDSIDGLPADVQKEYKQVDDKFVLDIEGDDLTPLVSAKNREKERATAATQQAAQLQEQLDEIRRGNIPKADVEALEASWKQKLEAEKQTGTQKASKYQTQLNKVLVNDTAQRLAASISIAPELLAPEIAKRLTVHENEDGDVSVRVKGADGKMSAMTVDELISEVKANQKYAPILIGSKASGGGANGNNQSGGGSGNKKLSEMNDAERIEFHKRDPEGFRAAMAASGR